MGGLRPSSGWSDGPAMRGVSFLCSPIHIGVSYIYPIWSIALAVISEKKKKEEVAGGGWVGVGVGVGWGGPGGQDPPPPHPPFWGTPKLQKEL